MSLLVYVRNAFIPDCLAHSALVSRGFLISAINNCGRVFTRKGIGPLAVVVAATALAACTAEPAPSSSSSEPVAVVSSASSVASVSSVSLSFAASSSVTPSSSASSVSSVAVSSSSSQVALYKPGDPIVGMDISYWSEQLDNGVSYVDTDGRRIDLLELFANHGVNFIRLRIFVDPSAPYGYTSTAGGCAGKATAYNGVDDIIRMAHRIKAAGMGFLLDFHYSDTWADPAKQVIPWAWRNANSVDELADYVESYTERVLVRLYREFVLPDMVQIGNEITPGMLIHVPTENSDCWGNNGRENPINGKASNANWPNLAKLLKAGIRAVNAVDPNIKTVLHIENFDHPEGVEWWVDSAIAQGVQFDVLGLSAYESFQGPADAWRSTSQRLASRYPQLEFAIVEYNQQGRLLFDAMRELPDGRGLGTFFWEPTESGFWGDAIFDWRGNELHARPQDFDQFDQIRVDYPHRRKEDAR